MTGAFLSYSLQAAVVMALLYLGYKWLMASSTFYRLNRAAVIASIIIPWMVPVAMQWLRPAAGGEVEVGMPIAVGVVSASEAATLAPAFPWISVLIIAYLLGIVATAAYTAVGACRMARIIRSGEKSKCGRYTLVVAESAPGPFSWGKYIILRPQDCDQYREMVVTHEQAHLDRLHWADLILAQFNVVLQWFNPAAWLLMHELKCIHEFQADGVAAKESRYDYQIMLLKKTVGTSFPTFADSLNHSQLKLRLTMMMKSKSPARRRLAALAIPAMTILAASALSIPSVAQVISNIRNSAIETESNSDSKFTISAVNGQNIPRISAANSAVADQAMPEEAADAQASDVAVEEAVEAATMESAEETSAKSEPQAPAYFVDGKLFTGSISELDTSEIKAMQIVKNDPAYPQGKVMIETTKSGGERPKAAVEKIAEFKGGVDALLAFLRDNLRFPEGVTLTEMQRVIVNFTIGADGSVSDAKVIRGAKQDELNQEALRVVNLTNGMWIPGSNGGVPVATQFTLPVNFTQK